MGDIALRGNKLTKGQGGHGPIPYLNKPGQAQGTHGGKAKGGRIGLKHGTKPWGTGPKPGTVEFLQHTTQTPRKKKALGSIVKGGKKIVKKIIDKIKKKKRHESLDIPGSPGPHIGKYPGIDKAMKNIKKSGDIWGPGKAAGGRIGFRTGSRGPSAGERIKARKSREREWWTTRGGPEGTKGDTRGQKFFGPYDKELREKRPHSSPEGRAIDVRKRAEEYRKNKNFDQIRKNRTLGGRAPFKKGGSDKKWMQKVSASIKKRGTKGKCTPITKPGCTGRAKALAKTFKKIAARRKG